MLERCYTIKVCILHTDFGNFNSDATNNYLIQTGIIWKPLAPNTQQQNAVVERHMCIVVEGAQAQIIDSNLSPKQWAKSINTIVYIKNQSSTLAVHKDIITSIQNFYRGDSSRVNHIRIFDSEIYVFKKSSNSPSLISRA